MFWWPTIFLRVGSTYTVQCTLSLVYNVLLYTSFNPQILRNIIKKVAKICITQIIIELVCQNNCILLFF